jgi:2-methylcitrate dehydratase
LRAGPDGRIKAPMDRITTQIADFAAALAYRDLPQDVVHAAKQRLIDAIGCAIGGRRCDAAAMGRRLARGAVPAAYPGRVLCHGEQATAEAAAFINSTMIRYLDFNDTVQGGHPSDALGGIFALAEAASADGARLLAAMVVAYEVATRLIAATRLRERGWDQGFVIGIAAAAGVGNLLRLSASQIAQAVAIVTAANVPLRNTRAGNLSLWKGAATAFACRNGVFSALLAAEGMTGPETVFSGRHGVFEQITGEIELRPFDADYLTPAVGLKYWPVENSAQAGVWAALKLREMLSPGDIAEIDIGTNWAAWHEIGSEPAKWDPQTRETADHSLPYIFARALVDGGITVASFDRAAYLDPTLRPVMAKIGVRQDEDIEKLFPAKVMMRVVATDRAGRAHPIEIAEPRGHPRNPMDDGEIAAKFIGLAAPALGQARAAAALETLRSIEREPAAARLFRQIDLER